MDNITGRSTARRTKRAAKKDRRTSSDLSQVLRMTPTRGSRETLAAATALQRARTAALQKDSEATFVATQTPSERGHFSERAARRASDFKFASDPPVQWTPEPGAVDTDTDADDEEEYVQDEKINEEDEKRNADEPEAAAIAAAEDADLSDIKTPDSQRRLEPTQSDLDFIATDDEEADKFGDDPDYYPSTAEDNDEEEEGLLTELLDSGRLSEPQSVRVRTRLRTMQRERAIARTLFALKQDKSQPDNEDPPASISPPVTAATAARPTVATGHTREPL